MEIGLCENLTQIGTSPIDTIDLRNIFDLAETVLDYYNYGTKRTDTIMADTYFRNIFRLTTRE